MSAPRATAWVCSACQRRLQVSASSWSALQRRSYANLLTADNQQRDEIPAEQNSRPTRKRTSSTFHARNAARSKQETIDSSENELKALFKSTARGSHSTDESQLPRSPLEASATQGRRERDDESVPERTTERFTSSAQSEVRSAAKYRVSEHNAFRHRSFVPGRHPSKLAHKTALGAIKQETQEEVKRRKRKESRPAWSMIVPAIEMEEPEIRKSSDDERVENAVFPGFRWNEAYDEHPLFDLQKASHSANVMRRAVTIKNYGMAEHIWRTYEENLLQSNDARDKTTVYTDLTLFLRWAVQGRLKDIARSVWKMFEIQGLQTNHRHWTMMLKMAGTEHDLSSVKAIWNAMRELPEKPDNRAFVVLITSLCSCPDTRRPDIAEGYEEMFRNWKWLASYEGQKFLNKCSPAKREIYGPSVIPFNAGIYRILDSRHKHFTGQILQWMTDYGIKPSVNTFNILLNAAAKAGDMTETRRLMHEMKELDVKPDKITFTAVLDGILREVSELTEDNAVEQIEDDVKGIFDHMEGIGFVPSRHTYATALNALLFRPVPIVQGARHVLDHMERNHVEPSVYIATILVKHYMRPDSPQPAAAEALWQQIKERKLTVDRKFYDAMVQGYAATSETSRMVRYIDRASRNGHRLSWMSMRAALEALVKDQEMGIAVRLVEDLELGKGIGRLTCSEPKDGELFWGRVDDLRQSGILPPLSLKDDELVGRQLGHNAGLQLTSNSEGDGAAGDRSDIVKEVHLSDGEHDYAYGDGLTARMKRLGIGERKTSKLQ